MSRGWRVARAVAGLVVLVLVIASVDPAAVAAALAQAQLSLVIVGIAGLTASHLVPAAGWRAILGTTTGVWLPWRAAVTLFYAAQAIGGVTPANLGGDLHRAAVLRRAGLGWSVAVAPLVVQRATSYLALGGLAIPAVAFLAARTSVATGIAIAGLAAAAAVAIVSWVLLSPPAPLRGVQRRLVRLVGGSTSSDLPAALGAATRIGVALGLVFHAAAVGLTGLLVLAIDPSVPVGPVLAALAVARLALAVPLTPSGLGIQEGVLAVLFGAIGLSPDLAIAAMLLARLSLLATTAIGAVLLQRRDVLSPGHPAADAPAVR
jgi:glycosyltransferase 2 family protein